MENKKLINDDLIGLYHTKGVKPCNGLVFWYSARFYAEGIHLVAPHTENLDGTTPAVGSRVRCGTCGAVLSNISGRDVDPSHHVTRLQE